MRLIKGLALGLAVAGATLPAACSSSRATGADSHSDQVGASQGNMGAVGLQLQVAPGINIQNVTYAITGPNGFSDMKTFEIGDEQQLTFSLTLPVGDGYTITLTATDTNGDGCTTGAVSFDVVSGTQAISLNLVCTAVSDAAVAADTNNGIVVFEAGVTAVDGGGQTFCPGATSLLAFPTVLSFSSTVSVSASATQPGATFKWTAFDTQGQTGTGSFDDPSAATTVFHTAGFGQVTIQVAVGLPGTNVCQGVPNTTLSQVITLPPPENHFVPYTASPGQILGVNAVGCSFNPGSICTGTEAVIVQHDIDVNGVTPANVDTSPNAAITCLAAGGALDNLVPGQECEDLVAGTDFSGATVTAAHAQMLCIHALQDALNTGCASVAANVCFCGSGPLNGSCKTGGANGVAECTQAAAAYQLVSVNPLAVANPSVVVSDMGMSATAVGIVDGLLNTAGPANANCPTLLTPDPIGPAVTCAP